MLNHPRRALLIGVTEYDDPAIDSLPFVADDLDDLSKALRSVGYEVERHPDHHGDRDRIDTAIEQFCRHAEPGQQLLIFLSGHGIHRDGHDYLLPSSADTTSRKFTERCLEIDFDGHIEESRCGDVLVVVDACREGVRLREKAGYSYVHAWSEQQRRRSAGRTIAYLYACSSGEMARWKETPDGTFSLFTRAFSRAITDDAVSGTLTAVREAVRVRLENLSAEWSVPLQKPNLDGDTAGCDRLVLVDRRVRAMASRGASAWRDRAAAHAVWDLVRPVPDSGRPGVDGLPGLAVLLRDAVAECAGTWSRRYEELRLDLSDDPWWDDEHAIRMHDRLSWVVKNVLNPGKLAEDDKPPLSPAEAAVLVLLPFAQQLHRAQCAVSFRSVLDDQGDEAADFRRFVGGEARIRRRLARLDKPDDQPFARAVRWGAYHRWLSQRPQVFRAPVVAECVLGVLDAPDGDAAELLREVITDARLARLLRALRTEPEAAGSSASAASAADALAGTEIPAGIQTIAGGSPNEQHIRDRLIALILRVAEEFTIDVTALPNIMIDHIGGADGVDLTEVLRAVQTARWSARGRTRVLEVECPHQAVQVALADHTRGIAEVLERIDVVALADRTLDVLHDLPTHVASDGLRPLSTPEGRPRYDNVGFRFRLDDDRVQELLMGEQLYGDPALAIRELYQNALDACRYRKARTEHLLHGGRPAAPWKGRIAFAQGVDDDGRPWLECRDNGVGMSERELSTVFSNAGARFADLPDFGEEQAAWEREQIHFFPNSRFGIGVLSYFMLGDEIEVSTARFSRDGELQPRLQVGIDGPGSLCRVRHVESNGESGTAVRIFLRTGISVSCVDLLTRLLWVSEVALTATDGSSSAEWLPGELSAKAPIGVRDPLDRHATETMLRRGEPRVRAVPSSVRNVSWCDGQGGILADGLWAGSAPYGRIVNLTGSLSPRLTIDRRRILAMDRDGVRELQFRAIPDLLAEKQGIFTLLWLGQLAEQDSDLADAIAQSVTDSGMTFPRAGGVTIEPGAVGVFPLDDALFSMSDFHRSLHDDTNRRPALRLGDWRLRSYLRAALVGGLRTTSDSPAVSPARPSDAVLLSARADGRGGWLDMSKRVPSRHVLVASIVLGWAPLRSSERLRELGASLADVAWPREPLTSDDQRLLRAELSSVAGHWSDLSNPVPASQPIAAGVALGWSPLRAAERLRELGARLPDVAWPNAPLTDDDQGLLTSEWHGRSRWLDLSEPVPFGHVVDACARLGWPPLRAARRLRELGAQLPDFSWPDAPLNQEDQLLLSRDRPGPDRWLDIAGPIRVGQVVAAAARLGWSPARVAQRLRELGAVPPNFPWPEAPLDTEDGRLLSREFGRTIHWLDLSDPLHAGEVMSAGARLGWSPLRAAGRLRELGADLPEFPWPEEPLNVEDQLFLKYAPHGPDDWLDLSKTVPAAYVLGCSVELGCSPQRLSDRLRELGAIVPDAAWPSAPLSREDQQLLTAESSGPIRWIDLSEPVLPGSVIEGSVALGWSPRRTADRLQALGAVLPDISWSDAPLSRDDQNLLRVRITGRPGWLNLAEPVSVGHVMGAAATLGWPPQQSAVRLRELGAELPEFTWQRTRLTRNDQVLLSMSLDGQAPWLDLEEPIDGGRLLPGLNHTGLPVARAAERLQQLGAKLPAYLTIVPEELPDT
ncbi:wHTH domain-containing protein [Paractinoplanes globisporus]|uniref:Caspase family protein n=1 Tax=Paractinoplanes globisporus TaxID=113565 RepID=A0ABW6WS16_9ACTN